MKAVILAGGYGTRISEESHLKPKPMIEIGGFPIMWHIMKHYSHYGINDFVICCGYKGHIIKKYFADYYLHRSDITFDFTKGEAMTIHSNVAEPWRVTVVHTGRNTQTGGRIKRIQEYVKGERFFMTYGDGVSDINLSQLLDTHDNTGMTVTISAIQVDSRFGVLDINDETGTISGFKEKAEEDGSWINGGFMVMEPEIFKYLDGDYDLSRKPMETLSKEGKLGVHKHYGFWQCMDTIRDKQQLETLWDGGNAPWRVWQ